MFIVGESKHVRSNLNLVLLLLLVQCKSQQVHKQRTVPAEPALYVFQFKLTFVNQSL
jgi:hypothetical protein